MHTRARLIPRPTYDYVTRARDLSKCYLQPLGARNNSRKQIVYARDSAPLVYSRRYDVTFSCEENRLNVRFETEKTGRFWNSIFFPTLSDIVVCDDTVPSSLHGINKYIYMYTCIVCMCITVKALYFTKQLKRIGNAYNLCFNLIYIFRCSHR